jgi:hypothetical protein
MGLKTFYPLLAMGMQIVDLYIYGLGAPIVESFEYTGSLIVVRDLVMS